MRNMQTIFLPESSEDVAYTATPANFSIPDDVYVIRVAPTTDCTITYPDGPALTFLFGVVEYIQVNPGDVMTVERVSEDGSLNVGYMTN